MGGERDEINIESRRDVSDRARFRSGRDIFLATGGRGEQARRRRMDANFNRARMPQSSKDEEAVYSSTQGVLRIGHSLCATQPLI
ncbi:hypothetical protein VTN96DRAFT_6726 [Rasamsonia emersonii]